MHSGKNLHVRRTDAWDPAANWLWSEVLACPWLHTEITGCHKEEDGRVWYEETYND